MLFRSSMAIIGVLSFSVCSAVGTVLRGAFTTGCSNIATVNLIVAPFAAATLYFISKLPNY